MKVLVTGASGFIGSALVTHLRDREHAVRAVFRRTQLAFPRDVEQRRLPDLCAERDAAAAVVGCEAVIHAAARVHVMRDSASDPLTAFRAANVAGTVSLARQAAFAGVRRFVFLSSVKVNGDSTGRGRPFTADDAPHPRDPYGISKHEAELALHRIAEDTGMEVVVVRPVLVYGPGVKANFLRIMRLLHHGVPLPFSETENCRSLVSLDNLADLVARCLEHPAAARQTLLVSDGEDLSTGELLRRTARALGVRPRLFRVSPAVLHTTLRLAGGRGLVERLCGSLQVDISKTQSLLAWTPPIRVDDALARTAAHFLRYDA